MKRSLLLLCLAAITSAIHAQPADKTPVAFARLVPERKADVAWENDVSAYRIYGPPLANSPEHENSGIDVWFKRVPYSVIDRWYADDIAGRRSYHDAKSPEGYDGFKVGSTRGCGGTALWQDETMILAGVYRTARILSAGPGEAKFVVTYRYAAPDGPVDETKTITLKVGDPLFESRSVFSRDGRPLAGREIAVGLVTQTPKASITLNPKSGVMAIWDELDGAGFGTGAVIPPAALLKMIRQPEGTAEHALAIVKTDARGEVAFRAGAIWSGSGRVRNATDWLRILNSTTQ